MLISDAIIKPFTVTIPDGYHFVTHQVVIQTRAIGQIQTFFVWEKSTKPKRPANKVTALFH